MAIRLGITTMLRNGPHQHIDVPRYTDIQRVISRGGLPKSFPFGVDTVLQIPGFPKHQLRIVDGIGEPVLEDLGVYPGAPNLIEPHGQVLTTPSPQPTNSPESPLRKFITRD